MTDPRLSNIDTLDFRDAAQSRTFGEHYITTANDLGWATGGAISAPLRSEMLRIGKRWLKGVKGSLAAYTPADALLLISRYGLIHRIVYDAVPDPRFVCEVVCRALDARMHGDKSVDIYELYRQIDNGMLTHPELYSGKPLTWMTEKLQSWYEEFRTGRHVDRSLLRSWSGKPEPVTDRDILNRVDILLRANLWAFTPDPQTLKQRLRRQMKEVMR